MLRLKQPTDASEMRAYLLARSKLDADCWIWQGSVIQGKFPSMRFNGVGHPVRRVAYTLIRGPVEPKLQVGVHKDCHPLCVCPDHLVVRTKSEAITGHQVSLPARLKMARAKRAVSKLTQAQVQEILGSSESGVALAKRLGISHGLVSKIRLGQSWRDFTNPFLQLLAA